MRNTLNVTQIAADIESLILYATVVCTMDYSATSLLVYLRSCFGAPLLTGSRIDTDLPWMVVYNKLQATEVSRTHTMLSIEILRITYSLLQSVLFPHGSLAIRVTEHSSLDSGTVTSVIDIPLPCYLHFDITSTIIRNSIRSRR